MQGLAKRLEHWHNWASDTKFVWFPFYWMKPKIHDLLSVPRTTAMAILFSIYYNLWYLARNFAFGVAFDIEHAAWGQLFFFVFFFVWFNLLTRPLWNRRARKL